MWSIIYSRQTTFSGLDTGDICAESFNDFIVRIAGYIVNSLPTSNRRCEDYLHGDFHQGSFSFRETSYNMVRDKINKLKNSKSRDCFGISTRIVKTLKDQIIYPLTDLINECIREAVFFIST